MMNSIDGNSMLIRTATGDREGRPEGLRCAVRESAGPDGLRRAVRGKKVARRCSRAGFTLAEMLIAMAVTLLMMAALAKSFGVIGESVRDGRAKVELTAIARDVTLRINDELSRCTVPLTPPTTENSGSGYFLYYEGPLTDATSALLGRRADPAAVTDDPTNFLDTRYGDLDDYLAFTAVAPEGHWFRGKVPRFVLDQKTAEINGNAYDSTNFPGEPNDPIMITSKYAEIVYFASPEYATSASGGGAIYEYDNDDEGNPIYVDVEGNGLPDRVQLHRRVLLIRPDLNLSNPNSVRPDLSLSADDIALGSFVPPLEFNIGGDDVEYLAPDIWDSDNTSGVIPSIKTVADHGISVEQFANAWLIGMAPVHQQCDLSVRRVTDRRGRPTNRIAANSLGDLTKPENRFAHVRMPGNRFIGGNTFTSMPLLALGGTPPILNPVGNPTPPVLPAPGGVVIKPRRMSGFLRPEFVLGQDYTHTDVVGDGWGLDRMGEDILATNVLGFDVKAFDPGVRSFITSGVDGSFGSSSVAAAGSTASDDVLVTPNDLAFREALASLGSVSPGQQGGFVDLFYPFNAGGTVRGFGARSSDAFGNGQTTITEGVFRGQLDTPMSGLSSAFRLPASATNRNAFYSRGLYKSGRVITARDRRVILMQPAYDTYTDHYERDGFLQTFPSRNGNPNGPFGTMWYFNEANGTFPTGYSRDPDLGSNGIDDGGAFGVDDALEQETESPFGSPLRAVRVSVRLENPATRQIQQMSSVREFIE